MADAGEAGGNNSRFLQVDGKAGDFFTSCGLTNFSTLLQEQADKDGDSGSAAGVQVATPSPKRRSPKKSKVV